MLRFGAETIENGAETIENGAEMIENGAETIENGVVIDCFGGTPESSERTIRIIVLDSKRQLRQRQKRG